ncbi:MAG: thrombospondin type 3 repeat-containing protein [Planctomycetes bacterium]|nr:thrombospondin type 3 repeat-containing protein [Planctomycetota bacterium]
MYDAAAGEDDFEPFDPGHWTGTTYDLASGVAPWTELGPEVTHPNGTNNGEEHWTIRRWVSDHEGEVAVWWGLRKENPAGNGVEGILFVNGQEVDRVTIAGTDSAGVVRGLAVDLRVGDKVDLAHTPMGPTGLDDDGADMSLNWIRIEPDIPDDDGDGWHNYVDNCPTIPNPDQANADGDAHGDVCDNCPGAANDDQADRDRDGSGDSCEPAWIAHSIDDWSATGTQGENNWAYGYYNLTDDPDSTYSVDDFQPFSPDAWRGASWRIVPESAPWTEIGQEYLHPSGANNAEEHWAIRRWISDHDGEVAVMWHMRKSNPAGTGVSGYLFVNGQVIDQETIVGSDDIGVNRTKILTIATGDKIDLALGPAGVCADRADGSDGSITILGITAELPEEPPHPGFVLADSGDDWSFDGTQGYRGWYYGYYDQRDDVENGDGVYAAEDFTEFFNDDTGVLSETNHWNGWKWDLLDNELVGHGPWTELTCAGGHPAGNGETDPSVHWAVRRWVSDVEGVVNMMCYLRNESESGDGVIGRVFQNNTEISAVLSNGYTMRYGVSTTVSVGDTLDFAIDADGSGNFDPADPATLDTVDDGSDGTTWLVTIRQPAVPPQLTIVSQWTTLELCDVEIVFRPEAVIEDPDTPIEDIEIVWTSDDDRVSIEYDDWDDTGWIKPHVVVSWPGCFDLTCTVSDGVNTVSDTIELCVEMCASIPTYTGDANCDGTVNIADAICLLTFIFGAAGDPCKNPCCLANMDTNDSPPEIGVDIADAVKILSFLFEVPSKPMIAPNGMYIYAGEDRCRFYPMQHVGHLGCNVPCDMWARE